MRSVISRKVVPLPAPLLFKEGLGEVLSRPRNPLGSIHVLATGEESKTAILELR